MAKIELSTPDLFEIRKKYDVDVKIGRRNYPVVVVRKYYPLSNLTAIDWYFVDDFEAGKIKMPSDNEVRQIDIWISNFFK